MPEQSYETLVARRARSSRVCRLLSDRIGEVTSPGLGRWDLAWEIVRAPSSRFLEALGEWERTGEEEAMDRAKDRAMEVLSAWKDAERRYRAVGQPEARTEVTA